MTDRIAQLYLLWIKFALRSRKSIWLQYDAQTIMLTGSCPMEIAG